MYVRHANNIVVQEKYSSKTSVITSNKKNIIKRIIYVKIKCKYL